MVTEKAPKPVIEHRDRFGRLLKIGDCVAYPASNQLMIGTIKKLHPKLVGVAEVRLSKYRLSMSNKYPSELVILDGPEVTMYLLKNSG